MAHILHLRGSDHIWICSADGMAGSCFRSNCGGHDMELGLYPDRRWAGLRERFYAELSGAMDRPVEKIPSPPRACWADWSGAYQHVWLYPYLAPTRRCPDLPWIARIAVNGLDGMFVPKKVRKALYITSWHPDWHLELSVMPEELLPFAPWLAQLAQAHDSVRPEIIPDPPAPIHGPRLQYQFLRTACLWTEAAAQIYERYSLQEKEREEERHARYRQLVAAAVDGGPAQLMAAEG